MTEEELHERIHELLLQGYLFGEAQAIAQGRPLESLQQQERGSGLGLSRL